MGSFQASSRDFQIVRGPPAPARPPCDRAGERSVLPRVMRLDTPSTTSPVTSFLGRLQHSRAPGATGLQPTLKHTLPQFCDPNDSDAKPAPEGLGTQQEEPDRSTGQLRPQEGPNLGLPA